MDDFDTDADCRNPDILKKKWEWFEEALFPTRSISEDLLVIFCGNLIALDCCVKRAGEKADHWDIVNIRDKDGKSSWPEKNTEERINRIQSKISTKAFQQEYMNNPLSEGDTFKEMVWGKCPPLSKLQFVVAYGDPAPSNSKNKATSFKACFLIGYYDGKFYVYTGYLDHVVNEEYVNWYYYLREYVGQKRRYIITSRTTSCRILSTNRYSYLCLTKKERASDLSGSYRIPGTNRKSLTVSRETLNHLTGKESSSSTLTRRIIRT